MDKVPLKLTLSGNKERKRKKGRTEGRKKERKEGRKKERKEERKLDLEFEI